MQCIKIQHLEGGTFRALPFHCAAGSAHLCIFRFTKWMGTEQWLGVELNPLYRNLALDLSSYCLTALLLASTPVEAAEGTITLLLTLPCYQSCFFPSLLAYVRLGPHLQLMSPAPSATSTAFLQTSLIWLTAGGALMHALPPVQAGWMAEDSNVFSWPYHCGRSFLTN